MDRCWDSVSASVAKAYFPHRLMPSAGTDPVGASVESLTIGDIVFARIGWGSEVRVQSDHPGAYGVNIALSGMLSSTVGREEVSAFAGDATICPPDTPTTIRRWSESGVILGVRLDRDAVHRRFERQTGLDPTVIPHRLDLREGAAASWFDMVRSLWRHRTAMHDLTRNAEVAARLGDAVMTGLVLAAAPSSEPAAAGPRPGIVKRVLNAIDADPARAWTVPELAHVGGVGVRRLQEAFDEYVGVPPTSYLREVRLARVRADMRAALPGETVSDIAMRWGFMHMGRFAADYRRRFGETPSQSLHS